MKNIITLLLVFISITTFAQSTFGPVEKHGFGQLQSGVGYNASVIDMQAFKGKLYVGMGEDSGYVYRSATGDLGTFQKVFSDGGTFRMGNFETTIENGGYLYAATYNNAGYFHYAKRTSDGINWENYLETYNQYDRVEAINAFKGIQAIDSIYLVIRNNMGFNYLLRNSVDQNDPYNSGLTWDTVADIFSPFGAAGQVRASAVFNNKLYYAMDNNEIYETADGRTLSLNPTYDTEMGYSSGSGVDRIVSMESFGGYLYLGTHTSFGGAQLWRTADGITFDSLGILNPSIPTLVSMKSSGSKLFMIVRDFSGYYEIYSTVDGSTFVLEDNTELGDNNTNMQSYAPMEIFDNHLYVATTHDMGGFRLANPGDNSVLNTNSYGAQIHRTCLTGSMPSVVITEGDTVTVCPGASATLSATGASNYIWNNANTSAFLSTTNPGYYSVTTIDGNGCRNSDGAYILNLNSQAPVIYQDNYQISNSIVCSGDTLGPIRAVDPNNDYNCVLANGVNLGITTPTGPSINLTDLTIEAWIKPNGIGVLATEYDPNYLWSQNDFTIMRIGGVNSNEFYVGLPNVGSTFVGYISPSQWNHVVLRYNATTKVLDGLVNGFAGGYAYSGVDHTPASAAGFNDAFKFLMSSSNPFPEVNAIAKIRDIRIWNIARTDSAIFTDKHKLPVGVYPNLINHYKLLETSGVTAADASASNLTATVTGIFVNPTPVTWLNLPSMNVIGFNTAEFFPTLNTQYALQYTDMYGCIVLDSFKVETAKIVIDGSPSCGGNNAYLNYNSNLPLQTVNWTSITLGTTNSSSIFFSPPSDEWVYASDNSTGCLVTDSFLVKVGPSFSTGLPPKGPTFHACENTDYELNAQAIGGTAPYVFTWYYGNSQSVITTNSGFYTFNVGTTNHDFNIVAVDAIGCTFSVNYISVAGDLASTNLTGQVTTPPPSSLNVDNGFVYVFKHQPGNAGFDTVGYTPLDANGNYSFAPLAAGDYLIKVMPDEISFPDAVPTYYGNAFQWDSSVVFTHGCDVPYTANIEVVEVSGPIGTASVSGYIIEEEGFGNNRYGLGGGNNSPFVPGGPLKGIDVKLGKNPGGGIQARTMSDSTGFYEFDSIPVGGYKIYVDIPNLPMDSTREILISAGDSSVQNNYYADSASVYINPETIGIFASEKIYENNFSIYPNPAKGTIYLKYELKERAKVSFEILNAMGQKMLVELERSYPQGDNIFALNLESLHLTGGVYFVSMITKDKKYTQRIVVIE